MNSTTWALSTVVPGFRSGAVAVTVETRQESRAFLLEHGVQRGGDALVARPAEGVISRPRIRHVAGDPPQAVRVCGIGFLERLQNVFVTRPCVESRHGTPQQAASPKRPALQGGGDRLPVVGIVAVEPPEEEQAVGVHVVGHGVQPFFRLCDQRFVVQGVTQAAQTIEPVAAPFVRPGALVPEESFTGHLVVGSPGPLELVVILVHVTGETVPCRQAPVAQPAGGFHRTGRQRQQRRTRRRLKGPRVVDRRRSAGFASLGDQS